VRQYQGRKVFTWWQGTGGPGGGGTGAGTGMVGSLAHTPVASIGSAGTYQGARWNTYR